MGTTCLSETPSPPSPESTVVREQISLHQLHLQSWRHGGDAVRLAIPLDPRWCLRVLRVPVPGRASRSSRQTWSADSPCAGKWWPPWSPRSAGRRRSTDGESGQRKGFSTGWDAGAPAVTPSNSSTQQQHPRTVCSSNPAPNHSIHSTTINTEPSSPF